MRYSLIEKVESRHVALGVMHLPQRFAQMSLRQLKKMRRLTVSIGNLIGAGGLRTGAAYRTLGIDPRQANREIDKVTFELVNKLGRIPGTDTDFIPVIEPKGRGYERTLDVLFPDPSTKPPLAVRLLHRTINGAARLLPS